MSKKLLLFIASTAISVSSYAQETPEPSKIKVYTSSSNAAPATSNSYKWAVKTDLIAAALGELPIIAEYRIAKKFSVEASAAITYAYLPNSFLADDDEEDAFDSKAALGSSFRAAIKYYPSSDYDAIEGWAFGIQIFSKTTNREYGDDSEALQGKIDSKAKNGLALIITRQLFQDSNISFEWIMGVGIANSTRTYFVEEYNTTLEANEVLEKESTKTAPNVQFGFRIGFGN